MVFGDATYCSGSHALITREGQQRLLMKRHPEGTRATRRFASMWLLVLAIVILSFSAFFAAYLAEAYTTSFEIATFAKATSMALGFVGIIMLFVAVGWWGLAGIAGEWLLLTLSRVFWHKRFAELIARGESSYRTWGGKKKQKGD
ncbi:hypothetical protein ES703_102372 [subsurface metagenome]